MAKKYPEALRGAKILTAMKFRNLFKSQGKKSIALIGGSEVNYRRMFYNSQIQDNLRSRAFGKKGLQELAETERKRRKK